MRNLIARYTHWLHTCWPAGTVEKLPEVNEDGTTAVPQTGLALVHEGERITPAGNVPSGSTGARMGGGQVVNVTVNGIVSQNVIRELLRELRRVLGSRGLNESLAGVS